MINASKTKSGKWRCLGSKMVNGKRVRKSFTAATKRQAEMEMADWMASPEAVGEPYRLVSEVIENYIEVKSKTLSASTIASYRRNARDSFRGLDDLYVKDLTNERVQKWINQVAVTRNPKTVKNLYSQLMASLRFEYPEMSFNVSLPRASVNIPTIPGDFEIKRLLSAAGPEMRKAIYLAAFGGLRRGEIAGLTYGDINHDKNMIHIHRVIVLDINGRNVVKTIPKNATSDRYVELPKEVMDALGTGKPSEKVVRYELSSITAGFNRLKQKTGVNMSFHDLRHYSASIMHYLKIPDIYIMSKHGWKSHEALMIYRNVLEDKQNQFVDKVNDYFVNNFTIEP